MENAINPNEIEAGAVPVSPQAMTQLARELMSAKEEKEKLNSKLSEVNDYIEKHEAELFKAMALAEMDKLVVDGTSFTPKIKIMPSIISEYKEKFFRRLRARKYGSLIQPEIHPSRFGAFVNNMYEELGGQLPAWMTEYVRIYNKPTIATRRSK